MPSPLVRALVERHGLEPVDCGSIEDALARHAERGQHTLLVFTGDPAERSEANDVAVIVPELLKLFGEALRGCLVVRGEEDKLKSRFGVVVMPSLVVLRGSERRLLLPRVRDWPEYVEKIERHMAEAPAPHVPACGAPEKAEAYS